MSRSDSFKERRELAAKPLYQHSEYCNDWGPVTTLNIEILNAKLDLILIYLEGDYP